MSKIINYIRETRGEMERVNWPTRKQAIGFTIIVIIISIITSIYLGVFDFILSRILGGIIL